MWATLPRAKLKGDSGNGFEAASIGDCRLFRPLAENQLGVPFGTFAILSANRRHWTLSLKWKRPPTEAAFGLAFLLRVLTSRAECNIRRRIGHSEDDDDLPARLALESATMFLHRLVAGRAQRCHWIMGRSKQASPVPTLVDAASFNNPRRLKLDAGLQPFLSHPYRTHQ
jgi:hypothetical protein